MTTPEKSERLAATHDFKRKAILKAARGVFAREGKDGLTVRAVASEAGYAAGAVYSYFSSKDEIAAQLIAEDLGQLAKRLKDADAQPHANIDATKRLALLAAETFQALSAQSELLLLASDALGKGVLPEDVDRLLNGRLIAALMALGAPVQDVEEGREAQMSTVATAALVLGTAFLERSGRLKVLGLGPDEVLTHAVERLSKSA